jgi:3',5'-cyclic AMP phosphodiesterase CpdA
LKIIQVGDIHFYDPENTASPVDNKDHGFPRALSAAIGTSPLQAVFRALAKSLEDEKPELIAFMGDFTNRGDLAGLLDCLTYLRGLFPSIWDEASGPSCQLLIGNHDIDRKKDPEKEDRFHDINTVVRDSGFRPARAFSP